jgi:hypothetical protein
MDEVVEQIDENELSQLISKYIESRIATGGPKDTDASYVVDHIKKQELEEWHVLHLASKVVTEMLNYKQSFFKDSELSFLRLSLETIQYKLSKSK